MKHGPECYIIRQGRIRARTCTKWFSRFEIARKGEGKSTGYRTIIAFSSGRRAIFLFGFSKNDMGNIGQDDLALLKDAARQFEKLTEDELTKAVAQGKLMEIIHAEKI